VPLPGNLLAPTSANGANGRSNGFDPLVPIPVLSSASTGSSASADRTARKHQAELEARYSLPQRQTVQQAAQQIAAGPEAGRYFEPDGRLTTAGVQAVRGRLDEPTARLFNGEQGAQDLAALVAAQQRQANQTSRTPAAITQLEERQAAVDHWLEQSYQVRRQGQGQQQAGEMGRALLGEELARTAEDTLRRHSQTESRAVLTAARQVKGNKAGELISPDGRLTAAGIGKVKDQLDEPIAQAFSSPQGQRDLAILTAIAWQADKTVSPQQFQQAVARSEDGAGEKAAGRTVPRSLGLDPVAAGAHFASLNRFARLSEQAGLSVEQREQLLAETRQGKVSTGLQQELETVLQRHQAGGRGPGLKVDDLISGATTLPETLTGPKRIQLPPGGRVDSTQGAAEKRGTEERSDQRTSSNPPAKGTPTDRSARTSNPTRSSETPKLARNRANNLAQPEASDR
jgi:hypothetical protein